MIILRSQLILKKLGGNEFGEIQRKLKEGQWYRLKVRFEDFELSACSWVERAWHGFQIESLSSQLRNGLLASSSKRLGSRINVEPGIFCCSDNFVTHAREYSNLVPSGDNLYWSFMWEICIHRHWHIAQPDKFQWTQAVGSVCRKALWMVKMCKPFGSRYMNAICEKRFEILKQPLGVCSHWLKRSGSSNRIHCMHYVGRKAVYLRDRIGIKEIDGGSNNL